MDEWLEWAQERRLMLGLAAVLGFAGWMYWNGRPVAQPPGILAPEDPLQTEPASGESWSFRSYQLTSLAQFQIRARVLGTERYRFDRAAELSPVDLALGWGPMSDSRVLAALTIRQQDRFYFWNASTMPIPAGEVISHSANMHLIPATDAVAKRLLGAKVGQLVELRGQLIQAKGKDGFTWVSSLTRMDSGDGACEVIWVEAARVADKF
jgi:hypothetical protein